MTELPHKARPFRDYDESLMEALKQPSEAAEYLNVALEEGDKSLFLTALGNVARAHGFTNHFAGDRTEAGHSLSHALGERKSGIVQSGPAATQLWSETRR